MANQKKKKPTTPLKTEQRAVYPGTFDPITNGHIDLIRRSLAVFSELTVLVAHSKKTPLFDSKVRKELIEQCFTNDPG